MGEPAAAWAAAAASASSLGAEAGWEGEEEGGRGRWADRRPQSLRWVACSAIGQHRQACGCTCVVLHRAATGRMCAWKLRCTMLCPLDLSVLGRVNHTHQGGWDHPSRAGCSDSCTVPLQRPPVLRPACHRRVADRCAASSNGPGLPCNPASACGCASLQLCLPANGLGPRRTANATATVVGSTERLPSNQQPNFATAFVPSCSPTI